MARYYDIFLSSDMIQIMEGITRHIRLEDDLVVKRQLMELYVETERDLYLVAQEISRYAEESMKMRLEAARKRPKGSPPHLEDSLKAQPAVQGLARLGGVGVGVLDKLNREAPYWQVQEEGSAKVYPDFLGRELYGSFYPSGASGGREKPRSEYAGHPSPPGAEFTPGASPKGYGVVRHHIAPKYFMREGAADAFRAYQGHISRVSARVAERIRLIDTLRRKRQRIPRGRNIPRGPW